jgi:hypothetical protein
MKLVNIYQTIEDRNDDDDVLNHGPYFCSKKGSNGKLKTGIKEPWLGEGYYFWDTNIEDAEWWGKTVYNKEGKNYIVCHTKYDQHSPLLYDLLGDIEQFNEFVDIAKFILEKKKLEKIKFVKVLDYLKKAPHFSYKAIRVYPCPEHQKETNVVFPESKYRIIFRPINKVQVCFFDKTLLTEPYSIIKRGVYIENQTI